MDVILPVAGLGSRLRPQTWSKPKPLVSVAGKPILEHVLDRVMPYEPDKLVFITGYLGEQIEEWARQTYDLPMEFVKQPVMRGQTDAIIRAREVATKDALILFPDMIFEADFSIINQTDADVIMFTKEVDDPSALGVAVVQDGYITKLVEKPQEFVSNLAVIGINYVRSMPALYQAIEEQMRRGIQLKNEYFIADAFQLMIDGGAKLITAPVTEWEDCGNDVSLLATNRYLLDSMEESAPHQVGDSLVINPSYISETAVLERSIVGPYASIGAGVHVRNARISESIVEDFAEVDGVVIEQSIIGRRARVNCKPASVNVGDNSSISL